MSKDCRPDSPIRAPGFSFEGLLPSAEGTNSTEEPAKSSQPGPTSSSISEKHINQDVTVDKNT